MLKFLFAQNCNTPTGLFTSGISNYSATLNWNLDSDIDNYRPRYKETGSSSWSYKHNLITNTEVLNGLNASTSYIWQVKGFCGGGLNSSWSLLDTFFTANFPVDCYNTPNGTAYFDSCGNCVGGLTGNLPCIDFTPSVNISLSSIECNIHSDVTFTISQDPNEPDIASSIFSSNAGQFDFSGLSPNDIIGSSVINAGGGFLNVSTTLMVDFIITSDKISVKAVDDATGQIYGTFTIENSNGGVLVIATSLPDNNNITNGNSQVILLNGIFVNPSEPTLITFTSTINSELSDVDIQTSTENILCLDCNGDLGGTAFIDSCGNCVGGNTGSSACISFSPTVSVLLSNTNCDSVSDLTISVSQDPNEPDMSTSLFVSNSGYFNIQNLNIGDVIGTAVMTAGNGQNTFNTQLVISTIILSSNQIIVQSQDINTGLVLGSFTVTNTMPGVSISAQTIPDGNNVTSGNSQTVVFDNIFVNPNASNLVFTSTINSEVGDQDIQTFSFSITCLCSPNSSTTNIIECDSYTWNGITYDSSGTYTFNTTNVDGCDSIATLNLTINYSDATSSSVTACDTYTWEGQTLTTSGVLTHTYTNASGCDSIHTLTVTINNSDATSSSVTACDTYTWEGQTLTTSGVLTHTYTMLLDVIVFTL